MGTARGLLRLSQRPRLIPTTLVDTMARGLLMPSLRPRLIPTTLVDTMVNMVLVMPTTDMALATMAMDVAFMATMDKSTNPYLVPDLHQLRDLDLHQDLSVNQVLPSCQ